MKKQKVKNTITEIIFLVLGFTLKALDEKKEINIANPFPLMSQLVIYRFKSPSLELPLVIAREKKRKRNLIWILISYLLKLAYFKHKIHYIDEQLHKTINT